MNIPCSRKEFWYTVATLGSLNFFHTFICFSFNFKMILFYTFFEFKILLFSFFYKFSMATLGHHTPRRSSVFIFTNQSNE